MIRWSTVLIGTWMALAAVLAASPATPEWVLKGYCKGATLVEIKEGHYGEVDLTGVTVLAVYNAGKWIKFFVGENATKAQTDAVVEFLPVAEGFFEAPVRDVRNLPISVTRTKDKVKIATEGTLVELEQIRNADGEPIKVSGLPAHGFPYLDHTQYRTVALIHDSEKEKFNFSGTNEYTARIDASSDSTEE